ncbi:MAG: glucose-6-phosphate isomerase [Phycisphaerales bacterium]|nr:glucose-6-phosphate isomerase [Phycisphaerales bacterium]
MTATSSWDRFCRYLCVAEQAGLRLDISRMAFDDADLAGMAAAAGRALDAMAAMEAGAIANVGENRPVGHYWLRAPHLAPTPALRAAIEQTITDVLTFASDVHAGRIRPLAADASARFRHALLIGIGGSALGPQFVADALSEVEAAAHGATGSASHALRMHFLDNTDPAGIARVLTGIGQDMGRTLVLVVSKSGATIETRNGMLETRHAFTSRGLDFAAHAVAVTAEGSALDGLAKSQRWLRTFPMWDWVGGRTSVTSAVGLLPAALQGIDVRRLLAGAAACDEATRQRDARRNPALLMSLMWHFAGGGRGDRAMVVLPYCDRLLLFSRYLQQLVMESLGKETARDGRAVHQGLTVYGNKGSTDQHAFVQQLRDGRDDFFVTFIHALEDGCPPTPDVEPGIATGDYLLGFMLGTRAALSEKGRRSMTLTLPRIDAFSIGAMIALFERAVGFYAELIDVNAYDQPGVEAGKKAAAGVLDLQRAVASWLRSHASGNWTAEETASAIGRPNDAEHVFQILERLAANDHRSIRIESAGTALQSRYRWADRAER